MIKVSVMYPNTPGARFDHAYYRDKHMPLITRRRASSSAERCTQIGALQSTLWQCKTRSVAHQIRSKENPHEYPRCFDYWRTHRYRACHRIRSCAVCMGLDQRRESYEFTSC